MDASLKRTKIIATVGPASNNKEMLLQFAIAGVNTFRLNFSHGTHEDHLQVIKLIREINKEFDYNLAILQDLQGPKIRVGLVENNGVELKVGAELVISTGKEFTGTSERVHTSYEPFSKDVKVGETVLVDDGRIRLRVEKIDGNNVHTKVIYGGILKSRKGMNLPDTRISASSLTEKDLMDLSFGLKHGVDWVAISFVRTPQDIGYLRNLIHEHGSNSKIIAKIERPEALKNINEIIEATDAVMVARGDLGIETSFSEVPIVQKEIVMKCQKQAKPVIVATQMLESMVKNPLPTRAETNDVASAVMSGADGVMLSEESAAGMYPLHAVKCMAEIIRSIEISTVMEYNKQFDLEMGSDDAVSKEVIQNATILAKGTKAKAIIGLTESGFNAFQLAKHRPSAKIFIFTKNRELLNSLNLIWGVRAFFLPKYESIHKSLATIEKILLKEGLLEKDDLFISIGTLNPDDSLKSNLIKIGRIAEKGK
ncbi:MAG: pyruvate kinase [Cytophagales bacterium]|nr:pyruvate kinase [Cytophagales bacterium]